MIAITSRARSHLRSLAHPLKPVMQIGMEGIGEAVIAATKQVLHTHELIKVKLTQSFDGDKKEAARTLADATDSDLTQLIGRTVVLYRPRSKDLPDRPRIQIPN